MAADFPGGGAWARAVVYGRPTLTSYEALFLAHLPLIERIARHAARGAHLRPEDVEDFLSDVKLKLLADDYRKLRECSDPAKLPGFLNITIRRLLIDKQQHDWGKWRPSAEAKRFGPVGELLDLLLTRDGLSRDEAYEAVRRRVDPPPNRAEVERIAEALPLRTKRRLESDERLDQHASAEPSPVEQAEAAEAKGRTTALLVALRARLGTLEPEERFLVLSYFEAQQSMPQISISLGVTAKSLYGRLDRSLSRLRRGLAEDGFEPEPVRDLLRLTGLEAILDESRLFEVEGRKKK